MQFHHLFSSKRKTQRQKAALCYETIIQQSRKPVFFDQYGVPDTVDGRFEMVMLHLFLLIDRIKREGTKEAEKFNQILFDYAFMHMDQELRQMGIGDMGVPRHIKRMAKAFYGRAAAYQGALDKGDDTALVQALTRNLFGTCEKVAKKDTAFFVDYMKKQRAYLLQESIDVNAPDSIDFAHI